jgi:putative transposase
MTQRSPFRCFKTSPEVIRLAVMLYIRFPLPLRNVEDLLHERGIGEPRDGAGLVAAVRAHVRG